MSSLPSPKPDGRRATRPLAEPKRAPDRHGRHRIRETDRRVAGRRRTAAGAGGRWGRAAGTRIIHAERPASVGPTGGGQVRKGSGPSEGRCEDRRQRPARRSAQRFIGQQENGMRKAPLVAVAALLGLAGPAWAQGVKGTVTKVDPAAGKVTLDHAPIPKLGMDAMIMAYKVKDPAELAQLRPGDKVDFEADEAGGQYTVTRIRKSR